MASKSPRSAQGSLVPSLIASSVAFLIVCVVVVSLRFYVRLRVIRKIGIDDKALAATLFTTIGTGTGVIYATRLGLGSHYDTLPLEKRGSFLKLIFFTSLGYHSFLMILKATFLLQYRRVFPLPAFQRICNIFLVFLAVWAVAGLVGGTTICLPVTKNWDPHEHLWTCEGRVWFWMVHGILHVITDVIIFVMPLPLLKTLPLPPVQKVVLIGIFCIGFLTCVISGLRLTTIRPSLEDPDITWASSKTVYWSFGEVTCSIFCLCVPTLRPLLGRCCASRRITGDNNIMMRGPRGFHFTAMSLPSTVGTGGGPPSSVGVGAGTSDNNGKPPSTMGIGAGISSHNGGSSAIGIGAGTPENNGGPPSTIGIGVGTSNNNDSVLV